MASEGAVRNLLNWWLVGAEDYKLENEKKSADVEENWVYQTSVGHSSFLLEVTLAATSIAQTELSELWNLRRHCGYCRR